MTTNTISECLSSLRTSARVIHFFDVGLCLGHCSEERLRSFAEPISVVRQTYRCSPKELAIAETQTEFLNAELNRGDALRAERHRDTARTAMTKVVEQAKGCAKPVKVAVVKPVVTDRDKDGDTTQTMLVLIFQVLKFISVAQTAMVTALLTASIDVLRS